MANKLTSKQQLPTGSEYIIRCTDEEFGPAKSSGNPMITLKFELVAPEEVLVDGTPYNIAGSRVMPLYLTTQSKDADGNVDKEKTDKGKIRIEGIYRAFDMAAELEKYDPENPTLGFKGKCVFALLYGKEEARRKEPTPEQAKQGKQGDIMKNPANGEELVQYRTTIEEIFGIAKTAANAPY